MSNANVSHNLYYSQIIYSHLWTDDNIWREDIFKEDNIKTIIFKKNSNLLQLENYTELSYLVWIIGRKEGTITNSLYEYKSYTHSTESAKRYIVDYKKKKGKKKRSQSLC